LNDREGYLKQIRESMTTLAQLPNAMLTLTMIPLMMSPKIFMSLLLRTKKPFEWLQTVAPDNRSGVKKKEYPSTSRVQCTIGREY